MDRLRAQYRIGGDHFPILKYGDSLSLKLNFRIHVLATRLRNMGIKGIQAVSSAITSLLIDYDPFQISVEDLMGEVGRLEQYAERDQEVLYSRLIKIPVVFGDRWTRACAEKFQTPPNLELVAEYNRISVEELIHLHSTTTYWILYLGFNPGHPTFVAIDPAKRISAPKYQFPRTRTPKGTLAMGGILYGIYSLESPGGFQMLGRTPLLLYDLKHRNPVFEKDFILFKPGDRINFERITHREYLDIERNFSSFRYAIEEEDFVVSQFFDE